MKNYTTSQLAEALNVTPREIAHLIRKGHIKGDKINPGKRNSAYLISKREAERYQQAPAVRGRTAKRCEPCKHTLKKRCAYCERYICIKDYHSTRFGLPEAACKDCRNQAKIEKRKKTKII